MKLLKIILLVFAVCLLSINLYSQDNAATPEYEATKQTEKLQQELNLSITQVKQVYDINLKYARARQNSTSRSDAMERMKNKDTDLQKVLNAEQINRLQNKRYERSSFQSVIPTNFRSVPQSNRSQTTVRQTTNQDANTYESRRNNSTMQTNRRTESREPEIQTNRRAVSRETDMQTNRRAVNREPDVQTRTVTPRNGDQKSVVPTPRTTTPSLQQNPETNRGTNSSGSQRR